MGAEKLNRSEFQKGFAQAREDLEIAIEKGPEQAPPHGSYHNKSKQFLKGYLAGFDLDAALDEWFCKKMTRSGAKAETTEALLEAINKDVELVERGENAPFQFLNTSQALRRAWIEKKEREGLK